MRILMQLGVSLLCTLLMQLSSVIFIISTSHQPLVGSCFEMRSHHICSMVGLERGETCRIVCEVTYQLVLVSDHRELKSRYQRRNPMKFGLYLVQIL